LAFDFFASGRGETVVIILRAILSGGWHDRDAAKSDNIESRAPPPQIQLRRSFDSSVRCNPISEAPLDDLKLLLSHPTLIWIKHSRTATILKS